MYAQVIVDLLNSETDKIFDYKITLPDVSIGSRVVVPFGNKNIEGVVIGIKETSDFDETKIKGISGVLDGMPVMTKETLALSTFITESCFVTRASALRLFLPSEMRKGKVREQYKKFVTINPDIDYKSAIDSLSKNAVKQREFLESLSASVKVGYTESVLKFGASAVKGAVIKGFAILTEEKILRSPYSNVSGEKKNVTLTLDQQNAVNTIVNTEKQTTLIFGVTGSGKTEVYLNLIEKVIKEGKTAIMLVPEISLTPQMLRQLRARFGELAAILHSGLSAGERFDEWWRLRSGEARIAIGARSAVFAPLSDLGLIIIDEEHDGSYQSESSPRYNTVEVAKFRAEYSKAKLVLGSATPSLESFLCAERHEYELVELPERINKKPLPVVDIVDMRKEIRRGNNTPFSSLLKDELKRCLDSGNQAILFLNQRGYSKSVICAECGHVIKCGNCDVSLTYHKEDDALLCHYCGAKYKMVDSCPECGSKFIRYGGVGTEKVCEELSKLFPSVPISRMDRDTTQNKDTHFKILEAFSKKESRILVGTQMIAKGHDFPSVTLVGILDADASLHFSDFRSSERTFELLTQVAGRSGRAEEAGKVVLQTYSPDDPVLSLAFRYDYKGFYEREISLRAATGFPPFTKIVRVVISDNNEQTAIEVTKAIYGELKEVYERNKGEFRFFGALKAPIKKLLGKFRYEVLMRLTPTREDIIKTVFYTANKYNNKKTSVYLEINPNNLN